MNQDVYERLPREVAVPRLVEEHGGRLFTLGKQFCASPEEAEDVVQETYLQAWRKWDQFEGRSNPTTWLYTIASRVCQRFHRKRSGEPDSIDSIESLDFSSEGSLPAVPDENDPLVEQIRREGRDRIEAAIVALPQDFRMPLVLKEIVGLSLAEIASILEVKEATVKTRLHRARLKLREALEGALPRQETPPSELSREVCYDLLESKQEHLDRGLPFEFPSGIVCERCATVFASMDFARETCSELARGELPEEVRNALMERIRSDR